MSYKTIYNGAEQSHKSASFIVKRGGGNAVIFRGVNNGALLFPSMLVRFQDRHIHIQYSTLDFSCRLRSVTPQPVSPPEPSREVFGIRNGVQVQGTLYIEYIHIHPYADAGGTIVIPIL